MSGDAQNDDKQSIAENSDSGHRTATADLRHQEEQDTTIIQVVQIE